jgi:dolichyl-phosphate-mannose-protein mannosyltransferase
MKKVFFLTTLLVFIFCSRWWLSTLFFNHDVVNHMYWVDSLKKDGLVGFYDRDFTPRAAANYPPLTNFLFLVGDKLYDKLGLDRTNLNLLASFYKLPSILAETFLLGYFFLKSKWFLSTFFLLNPGLFYNSLFWGQIEGLITALVFFSVVSFFSKRPALGFIFYLLAILSKQSAFVFLPVILLLAWKKTVLKEKIVGFFLGFVLLVLVFSFFAGRIDLIFPLNFYKYTVGGQKHQHLASVNAFNFWYLLGFNNISDAVLWKGISFRFWGVILTLPLMVLVLGKLWRRPFLKRSLMACGVLNFAACLFLTRIHERHLFPSLVFLLPSATWSFPSFVFYLVASLIHFLNLYWVWQYPGHKSLLTVVNREGLIKIVTVLNLPLFSYFLWSFLKLKDERD